MKKFGLDTNSTFAEHQGDYTHLLFNDADSFYIPQVEPAERVERRIAELTDADLNLPEWNWCGMCCLAMLLDGLRIDRSSISQMYKEAFEYGVYQKRGEKIIGAIHKSLAKYASTKYRISAEAVQGIGADDVSRIIQNNCFFIASVTPEIRFSSKIPTRKNGHLVLVFGIKQNGEKKIIFHNPSGFSSNNSQKSVEISNGLFENYFSGNGICVSYKA